MKIKTKVIVVVAISFVLVGIIFLQQLSTQELKDQKKQVLSSQDTNNAKTIVEVDEKISLQTFSNSTTTNNPLVPVSQRSDNITEMNPLLDSLPLPSPTVEETPFPSASLSVLSFKEQGEAISFFEAQHRSWLAIKSGKARYTTKVRILRDGKFVELSIASQTGTLEFLVTPIENPTKYQSPIKIQVRLFNDKYKINFVKENVFDSKSPRWQWADDPKISIEGKAAKFVKGAFQTELFFFPMDFMAKTYAEELGGNDYTMPKGEFFEVRGVARRKSTKEETDNIFEGEPQYLFQASPALVDAHYWFSTDNGELRRIDVFIPERDLVKSFRYENYIKEEGQIAQIPQRFTLTWKRGNGDKAIGWEYIVELENVSLNKEIPSDRFNPPKLD